MTDVLVASDAPWVVDDIRAALDDAETTIRVVTSGADVLPAVEQLEPDLAVLDLQIGNMGGMAVCMHLRLEESAARIGHVPVLMLLDRRPDVFLARRSGAEGWLIKPLDPIRIRRAVEAIEGGHAFEDTTDAPTSSVPSPAAAEGTPA